jgi:DNA replication protein DnaC
MSTTTVQKTCRRCGGFEDLDVSEIDLDNSLTQKVMSWWRKTPCTNCANEQEQEEKRAKLRDDFARRLHASALPEPFHRLAFPEMDASDGRHDVVQAAEQWAQGSNRRLFLQSRPGTGKTRLAATACVSALWRRQVYWCNAATLFRQAAADFKTPARREAETVLQSKSALVLDDLGNENPTKAAQQALQALLQRRLEHDSCLLITSNLTVPQLAARYEGGADWLASRLATFDQWTMPGIDRRLELPL